MRVFATDIIVKHKMRQYVHNCLGLCILGVLCILAIFFIPELHVLVRVLLVVISIGSIGLSNFVNEDRRKYKTKALSILAFEKKLEATQRVNFRTRWFQLQMVIPYLNQVTDTEVWSLIQELISGTITERRRDQIIETILRKLETFRYDKGLNRT